jgi:serine/threonine protein kinase
VRLKPLFDEAIELPDDARAALIEKVRNQDERLAEHLALLLEKDGEEITNTPLMKLSDVLPPEEQPVSPKLEAKVKQIGRYRIVKELGHGGMGTVYEAVDPAIGRAIAIKTIRLESLGSNQVEFLRDRLFREARLAGKLSHSGIVIIFDVGEHDGAAYIAMELVNGPSLEQILSGNRRLGYAKALDYLMQAARALDYAHSNGVIHRDVKPANMMIQEGKTLKIADFGIAKITETLRTKGAPDETASTFSLTQPGKVMGTPAYMSPEQMRAEAVTGRSDQFSLAVVGFRMLSGILPFRSDSIPGLVHEIVYGARPSLRLANPDLPIETDHVLTRALGQLPQDRFVSCVEFVNSLEIAIRGSTRPSPSPPRRDPGRFFNSRTLSPKASPKDRIQSRIRAALRSRVTLFGALAAVLILVGLFIYKASDSRESVVANPEIGDGADVPLSAALTADHKRVHAGDPVTLRWRVDGATDVSIEPGIGKVPNAGSREMQLDASTTYILTAKSRDATTRAPVTIQVLPEGSPVARDEAETPSLGPPTIVYFHTLPPVVKPGEDFDLVWNVIGAKNIVIDQGIGHVIADAGRSLPAPAESTTYKLRAEGRGGSSEALATVIISKPTAGTDPVDNQNEEPFPVRSTGSSAKQARVYKLSEAAMNSRNDKRVFPVSPPGTADGSPALVRLSVLVDPSGNVSDIEYKSGDRSFFGAAKTAAKQYHYRPYLVNGQPVPVRTEITLKFNSGK